MSFQSVTDFENKIAEYFGSPYAISVDCCTHGIELCLRLSNSGRMTVPTRTYLSIPFLADKLDIKLHWKDEEWKDYYYINTDVHWKRNYQIIDAAVLWKKNSYMSRTFMCLSFQFQKHLSLGRGGMILTDDKEARDELKKMTYDGRLPNIPWREQNIKSMGYHYYMTPETAINGMKKLPDAIKNKPKQWLISDYPDLRNMEIFKNG